MPRNLKVLIAESDTRFNAALDRWTSLADAHQEGFRRATEILLEYFLEDIESAANDRDTVVLPILFLFRHYLEIRFKEIITTGNQLLGSSSKLPSGHKLRSLWLKCLTVCEEIYGSEFPGDMKLIEECVNDLEKLDCTSQNFRYPLDLKGNVPFVQVVISLRILSDISKMVMDSLEGISSDLSIKCDSQREHPI